MRRKTVDLTAEPTGEQFVLHNPCGGYWMAGRKLHFGDRSRAEVFDSVTAEFLAGVYGLEMEAI